MDLAGHFYPSIKRPKPKSPRVNRARMQRHAKHAELRAAMLREEYGIASAEPSAPREETPRSEPIDSRTARRRRNHLDRQRGLD